MKSGSSGNSGCNGVQHSLPVADTALPTNPPRCGLSTQAAHKESRLSHLFRRCRTLLRPNRILPPCTSSRVVWSTIWTPTRGLQCFRQATGDNHVLRKRSWYAYERELRVLVEVSENFIEPEGPFKRGHYRKEGIWVRLLVRPSGEEDVQRRDHRDTTRAKSCHEIAVHRILVNVDSDLAHS